MTGQADLLRVVTRSVGVYGTAPTCFLSALARDPEFTLDRFNQSIHDRRLVRIRAMRYSVHTFPVELLPIAAAATKRLTRKTNPYRKRVEGRYDELMSQLDEALADGPLAAADIRSRIDPERELGDLFSVALGMAAADFRVVRTTTTGTWRSDRFLYARWQDWLPDCDPDGLDEQEAMRQLVELYVQAYGPVTYDDVKWWTGWNKAETVAAIDGIDLERQGNALDDLAGVRLLPVWDVLMVAYRNRDRLFDSSYAPLIHDRYGNATSVVLDAGKVVGQWDLGSSDDPLSIKVAPFSRWSKRRWNDVTVQAGRIGKLLGTDDVDITPVNEPVDLLDSSRNRFLAPLSRR
jgi:hypothetical protein